MPRAKTLPPSWGDEAMRVPPPVIDRRGVVARPYPPDVCGEEAPICFVPDPRFAEWILETFVAGSGPLQNEEHEHLLNARLGVLWTNAINRSKGRLVLATAEIPAPMAGGWRRERHDYQLREWFGVEPHFLLTFSAPDCERLDDRAFCALVEHELYHCAQAEGENGPRFSQATGEPIYTIRGHDVEEFTGVVRRYGATSRDVRALVAAANAIPLIDGEPIGRACGTVARAA